MRRHQLSPRSSFISRAHVEQKRSRDGGANLNAPRPWRQTQGTKDNEEGRYCRPRRLLSRRANKQSRLLWPDGEVGHCGHHHLEFTPNLPEDCDVRCVCSGIRALEVHRKAQPVSRLSDRDDGVGGAPAAAKEMSPRIAAVATTLFWAFHKCLADDRLMG